MSNEPFISTSTSGSYNGYTPNYNSNEYSNDNMRRTMELCKSSTSTNNGFSINPFACPTIDKETSLIINLNVDSQKHQRERPRHPPRQTNNITIRAPNYERSITNKFGFILLSLALCMYG